jgi:hypothetical protein
MEYKTKKVIDEYDWNQLVIKTYGKPYTFQQQEGCMANNTFFELSIPCEFTNDEDAHEEIPEILETEIMGVKFDKWLARDPKQLINGQSWETILWWERNFYPDIYTLANDMYEKGVIEKGEYIIKIDW